MALALAIPLRAGLINLGGDGQLVLGGVSAAVTGLYSPLPAPLTVVLALLAGMAAGAAYAALAALCENRLGVPLLVSSLLLSYPAVSLASCLARYPLKEPGSSLPRTRRLPEGVALPAFGESTVTVGLLLVVPAAVGVLCGLAGAQLALGNVTLFSENMTAGRGWIAVVAVMLGRALPLGVLLAALLFGVAEAAGFRLQGLGLPQQATDAAPYVVTLGALFLTTARRRTRSTTRTDSTGATT
ncbi:ABC transporter permease [Streptomyces phaeolivaceus]|uniref:ABC transporter permease n=2 Tax=Streptomyces phaeolivaceus TaxID=2653200 RepID=A0A5P8KIJ5_9ACTN|nr:ABC transporter permease [Streptomyces phaeolivaceus]